jgi:hypothetical protein
MNCELFNEVVYDLVREDPDASIIADFVKAHAEGCDQCAQVLAAQQLLQINLRMLAASQQGAEAPQSVERLLRQAFVSNHARRAKAEARPIRAFLAPLLIGSGLRRPVTYQALAAAVVLLFVAGLAWFARSQRVIVEETTAAPGPISRQQQARRDTVKNSPPVVPGADGVGGQPPISGELNARLTGPRPSSRLGRKTRQHGQIDQAEDSSEVATDFMPIDFGGSMMPAEGGQVLRIKVPRSVMISYGLPINPDRIDEPISADLVVGNDGLATAIRFVEENAVEKSRRAR